MEHIHDQYILRTSGKEYSGGAKITIRRVKPNGKETVLVFKSIQDLYELSYDAVMS